MATTSPPFAADPEKVAREVARQFVSNLKQVDIARSWRLEPVQSYPLMADIESAIEDIHGLLRLATFFGEGVFCIRDGNSIVPVVKLAGQPPPPLLYSTPYIFFSQRQAFQDFFGLAAAETFIASPSDVAEMILTPLTDYLTVRFRWLADHREFRSLGAAAAANANSPYLPFVVTAKTPGLRIHYTKTFALNFNDVFGAPTSPNNPLHGWILPGIHRFAGVDINGNFHYDGGTFTTPPDFVAPLVI